jgi:peptide subunit release factor 1 (eRF1)
VHVTAGGASGPETKSAAGGWSQKRYQQRAEKTWDENAERVADRLTDIVHDVQAATVVVAGDPKAVELMVSDLAPDVAELVHHVAGSRAAGGRERAFDESLRWARDASARQTVAVLERFHADSGVHQRAVQGRAATAEALAEGRVQMLLVSDDGSTDHEAFFGPNPLQIGLSRETVAAMGVPEPQLGRTPDVFVRAALGSSAGVRVLPSATSAAEGVGALLRW